MSGGDEDDGRRRLAKADYEAWRVRVMDNPTTEADIQAALEAGTKAASAGKKKN